MVIWTRWGILVALVAFLGLFTGEMIYIGLRVAGLLHDARSSNLFLGLGLMIGGGYTWLFDRHVLLRHLEPPRVYTKRVLLEEPEMLDDGTYETHYEYEVREPRSTLFFVPVQYWWIVLTVLGGVAIAGNVAHFST